MKWVELTTNEFGSEQKSLRAWQSEREREDDNRRERVGQREGKRK